MSLCLTTCRTGTVSSLTIVAFFVWEPTFLLGNHLSYCITLSYRNPEIPIENGRSASPTRPATPIDNTKRKSMHEHKFPMVHHQPHPSTALPNPPSNNASVIGNTVYRPSRSPTMGSLLESANCSERELVYRCPPSASLAQDRVVSNSNLFSSNRPNETQESGTATMKAAWEEGDWKYVYFSKYATEESRDKILAEFSHLSHRKTAVELLEKIADQHLEATINLEILNNMFDRSAWVSLQSVRYSLILLLKIRPL